MRMFKGISSGPGLLSGSSDSICFWTSSAVRSGQICEHVPRLPHVIENITLFTNSRDCRGEKAKYLRLHDSDYTFRINTVKYIHIAIAI